MIIPVETSDLNLDYFLCEREADRQLQMAAPGFSYGLLLDERDLPISNSSHSY